MRLADGKPDPANNKKGIDIVRILLKSLFFLFILAGGK